MFFGVNVINEIRSLFNSESYICRVILVKLINTEQGTITDSLTEQGAGLSRQPITTHQSVSLDALLALQ